MDREFEEQLANPNYLWKMKAAKHVVSDSLMAKAFGASPLLFQHAETTSNQTDDELSEIEMLKKLSVSEILHVFKGNDLPAQPPPRQLSSHANIWPPLPKGPPPPVSQSRASARNYSQC